MKYIIGMDGGGTKTHCIVTNLEGDILLEKTGDASNFLVKGTEKVSESIFNLIDECKEELKINYSDIDFILLGTTGAGRRADAERLKLAFIEYSNSKDVSFKNFHVESDARIALEGAFSGKPGSILIAGTGSIMFGKDINENVHRVGGFGRYIGDEGSGYSIGKKGLVAVSKDFDGRGEHTLISKLLNENYNIDSAESLIIEIYKNNFDIASAAPLVLNAAEQNDLVAIKIIDEETDELILHIASMAKKINEAILNVSLVGGIISNKNIFSSTLLKKIKEKLLHVNVIEPENTPAVGAVLLARKLMLSLSN